MPIPTNPESVTMDQQMGLHFPYLQLSGTTAQGFHHWVEIGKAQGVTQSGHYVFDEAANTVEALNMLLAGPSPLIASLQAVFSSGKFPWNVAPRRGV